jgi:uncharacterized protein YfdQ (DUF2303 family)
MSTDTRPSEFDAAFNAGVMSKAVHPIPGADGVVALRNGYAVTNIETSLNLPKPRRKSALVTVHHPDSFIDYVRDFSDKDSLITADIENRTLRAILDYHGTDPDGQRWGVHKVTFTCRETPEWKTWNAVNGKDKRMEQIPFAEFLEANLPDIADPPGGLLLEMVTNLEAKKDVAFLSSVRLADGSQQLTYNETIDTSSTQRGDLRIVDRFTLALAPFYGTEAFRVTARLRFRITSGKLIFWFELDRPHKVVETAFDDIVQRVRAGLPDIRLIHGSVAKEAQ